MNNKPTALQVIGLIHEMGFDEALKRLSGVQGPERHLVGDVAERITDKSAVEVSKTGRRGVGEIGGASELRKHVEAEMEEARRWWMRAANKGDKSNVQYFMGQTAVLVALLDYMDLTDTERSDLSNV